MTRAGFTLHVFASREDILCVGVPYQGKDPTGKGTPFRGGTLMVYVGRWYLLVFPPRESIYFARLCP